MENSQQSSYMQEVYHTLNRVHPGRYLLAEAWTDSICEFVSFTEKRTGKDAFFKLLTVPAKHHYGEEGHNTMAALLGGYLLNLNVSRAQQNFDSTTFLLESDRNYMTLAQLFKIKRDSAEPVDARFLIHLLQFLKGLLGLLLGQLVTCRISLQTICFQGDRFKLCDYNIYFQPFNLRSSRSSTSRGVYLQQIRSLLYSLVMLRNPQDTLSDAQAYSKKSSSSRSTKDLEVPLAPEITALGAECIDKLLTQLNERQQQYQYPKSLMDIIIKILSIDRFPEEEITEEYKRVVQECGETLTNSYVSAGTPKESFVESDALSRKNSILASTSGATTSFSKSIISKKFNNKRVFVSVLLFLISLGIIGAVSAYFILRENPCPPSTFAMNHRCYPCAQGCTSCLGQQLNQCTTCRGSLWLVKNDGNATSGVCSQQCGGIQISAKQCIQPPSNSSQISEQ